jgi:hypothetical protein
MGLDAIPGLQSGAILQARVAPVLDKWLITGTLAVRAPQERAGVQHGDDAPEPPGPPPVGESVDIIYDSEHGMGIFVDYAAFRESFQHPELVRQPRYQDVMVGYLTEIDVSPVPFRRCVQAWPEGADAVLAAVTRNPRFSCARHGRTCSASTGGLFAWCPRRTVQCDAVTLKSHDVDV